MNMSDWVLVLARILTFYKCTVITKHSTNLGIEGDNVKNIISNHKEGNYILIKWNE